MILQENHEMKKIGLTLLTAVICLLMAQSSSAISLNPFKREGRTRAHTLMITGNYLDSRLLAELAQHRTKQPILLISPDGYQNYQLFYMPPGGRAPSEPKEKFLELIEFINPKRIVILGDFEFVPQEFIDQIQTKYAVIIINSKDWEKNAKSLGQLLKQPKLHRMYVDYRSRMQESKSVKQN